MKPLTRSISKKSIDEILESKPIKYVAIGIGVVITIYLVGKVCKVTAQSIHGYKDLRNAIRS